MKGISYLLIIILFISSCSNKQLSPSEFLIWVEKENNLNKELQIENYTFMIQYIPNVYGVLKNIDTDNITEQMVDSLLENNSNFTSFIFKVSVNNNSVSPLKYKVKTNEEFSEKLQYCSYKISQDFYIVSGIDTFKCVNSLMERDYNISPYNTFILNFETLNKDVTLDDITLVYNDYVWNSGILKFNINKSELNKIPKLKFI